MDTVKIQLVAAFRCHLQLLDVLLDAVGLRMPNWSFQRPPPRNRRGRLVLPGSWRWRWGGNHQTPGVSQWPHRIQSIIDDHSLWFVMIYNSLVSIHLCTVCFSSIFMGFSMFFNVCDQRWHTGTPKCIQMSVFFCNRQTWAFSLLQIIGRALHRRWTPLQSQASTSWALLKSYIGFVSLFDDIHIWSYLIYLQKCVIPIWQNCKIAYLWNHTIVVWQFGMCGRSSVWNCTPLHFCVPDIACEDGYKAKAVRMMRPSKVQAFSDKDLLCLADLPSSAWPGYAYASCVNMGQPQLGQKMVTHSWRNKFSPLASWPQEKAKPNMSRGFLIGAIIADALGLQLYDNVVLLLKQRNFEELCKSLNHQMKLDVAYWICAFSAAQFRSDRDRDRSSYLPQEWANTTFTVCIYIYIYARIHSILDYIKYMHVSSNINCTHAVSPKRTTQLKLGN